MNHFPPTPALRLRRGEAGVLQPALAEKVTVTVRTGGPCRRRKRVDDQASAELAVAQGIFDALAFRELDPELCIDGCKFCRSSGHPLRELMFETPPLASLSCVLQCD